MSVSFVLSAEQILSRLSAADGTQLRVRTLSSWCLLHAAFHHLIVGQWRRVLCDATTPHSVRVGLLYVVHDLLYKISSKEFKAKVRPFVDDLCVELPLALDALFATVKNRVEVREIQERLAQLLECWKEMQVFPPAVIAAVVKVLGTAKDTHGLRDDGASILTVSNDVAGLARMHQKYRAAVDRHRRLPQASAMKLEDKFGEAYNAQREAALRELETIVDAMKRAGELIRYTSDVYLDDVHRVVSDLQKRQTVLCNVLGVEAEVTVMAPQKQQQQPTKRMREENDDDDDDDDNGGNDEPVVASVAEHSKNKKTKGPEAIAMTTTTTTDRTTAATTSSGLGPSDGEGVLDSLFDF